MRTMDIIPQNLLEMRIAAMNEAYEAPEVEVEKLPVTTRIAILAGLVTGAWTIIGVAGYAIYRIL